MRLKSPKAKGNRLEHKTMDWLEQKRGCVWTCRSGGSLGIADVVGIGSEGTYLAQVKANHKPGPDEMGLLRTLSGDLGGAAKVLVVVWKDRAKEPEVEVL